MSLLRRAFAREAYKYTDKLRILSDTTVRRRLRFTALESVTRMRRLKWYQSMLARTGQQHFLALSDWEKVADFGLNGSLTHRALPALRQFADDLTRFLPSWPGFVWGWVPMFLRHDFSGISEYSTSREVTASCGVAVPVSAEPFSRMCRVPTQDQSARLQESKGCPFQGQTCLRGVSLFLPQRSRRTIITAAISSASSVRNRGALTRVAFLQHDLRRVRPRTEEGKKGSARSKRFFEVF